MRFAASIIIAAVALAQPTMTHYTGIVHVQDAADRLYARNEFPLATPNGSSLSARHADAGDFDDDTSNLFVMRAARKGQLNYRDSTKGGTSQKPDLIYRQLFRSYLPDKGHSDPKRSKDPFREFELKQERPKGLQRVGSHWEPANPISQSL